MVEFDEISAEKIIATSDDVAINPYLLLHATYTGFAQTEKSSHLPRPKAAKLCFITWKNGFIASSGEGFHHMAVIPRRTIFLGESGAVFLCNINTDKKQPRGDPPIISQVQKYF